MSKNNIDKLFQEKLKDFQEIPHEKVWGDISRSLDKKKSRKVIPLWRKLGGVAALVAVLFMVINPFEDTNTLDPIISDTENLIKENQNSSLENGSIREKPSETIQLADTETNEGNTQDGQEKTVSNTAERPNSSENSSRFKNIEEKKSQLTAVDSEKVNQNGITKENIESAETYNGVIKSAEARSYEDALVSEEKQNEQLDENPEEKIFDVETSTEKALANVSEEVKEKEVSDDVQKKSIYDEIEKQAEEDEALAESSKNKWSVGANVAPVYFSSFGEGSPIDPAFNTNSKSGDFNMSYGLSIAYNVTNKLSVRTGVNKVDFGYDTNEVEFSASLQGSLSSRLNNINYSESAENVVVENKTQNSFALSDRSEVVSNDISRNGVVAQEFGYIEVPVELDYTLVENRFGVNLIGGVSTLFLTNNSVVLNDANETIELGEANNLNNVNFSTNIGFGLNYKFSSKIRLNVEPVFKYQLGTFSDTSGSFNPFSVGVYSGLNFRF